MFVELVLEMFISRGFLSAERSSRLSFQRLPDFLMSHLCLRPFMIYFVDFRIKYKFFRRLRPCMISVFFRVGEGFSTSAQLMFWVG